MSRTIIGKCALCEEEQVELQQSHIIPKGIYKRTKSFKNSRFRCFYDPKQILQDGEKNHLLCHDCEEFFSGYETRFDNKFLDLYLKSPEKDLPKISNITDFYITTVSWRILYDDLYNRNSYIGDDERDIMKEYELKLRRYILERYHREKPNKKLPLFQYEQSDLTGKTFGELIAEAEKYEQSQKPEDLSEIHNYVFKLVKLGFSPEIVALFDSMIIGYSFYDSSHTKFYVISLYKGLIISTVYCRKRSMIIGNLSQLLKKVSGQKREIINDLQEEINRLLENMAQEYDTVQKTLDEKGLREKIAARYYNTEKE